MFNSALYDLTQNLQGAIAQQAFKHYSESLTDEEKANQPTPPVIMQLRRGLAESPAWFMVQAAEFRPEPLSVERLRVRAIWSSPSIVQALLELLASEKWFDRRGDDYHLTDAGHAVIQQRQEYMVSIFDSYSLEGEDAHRLEVLLRQVIDLSLESADPPGTWCLRYSRRRAPSDDSTIVQKILQYFSDLNAFRDDAHMASWREHKMDGYVWESFASVGDGKTSNADELFDQLAYRGYSRQDFANALQELVNRGWLAAQDGRYAVTEKGSEVRAESEQLTDEYFYASWFEMGEANELRTLLQQFYERFT